MTYPDNTDVNAGGAKFDAGKVRMDLVPGEFVYGVAAAMTYGAIKYDDWNWSKGMRVGRILAALLRHVYARLMGEAIDPESGLPHTWHMGACVAMVIGGEARGTAVEDIPPARHAYELVQIQYARMKDPGGTKKNGGGSLIEGKAV